VLKHQGRECNPHLRKAQLVTEHYRI